MTQPCDDAVADPRHADHDSESLFPLEIAETGLAGESESKDRDGSRPDGDPVGTPDPDDPEEVVLEKGVLEGGVRWKGLRTGRIDCGHRFGIGNSVVRVETD